MARLCGILDMRFGGDRDIFRPFSGRERAVSHPTAVKSLGGSKVGGYLVRFGKSDKRDLHGEFFTSDTNFQLELFDKRPIFFHHGLDGVVKSEMLGAITKVVPKKLGLWVEGVLDMRNEYARKVRELVERGALGWSSSTLPHLRKIADTGEVLLWPLVPVLKYGREPLVEGSLTPTPANPFGSNAVALKSLRDANPTALKAAFGELDIPWLKALEAPAAEGELGETVADAGEGGDAADEPEEAGGKTVDEPSPPGADPDGEEPDGDPSEGETPALPEESDDPPAPKQPAAPDSGKPQSDAPEGSESSDKPGGSPVNEQLKQFTTFGAGVMGRELDETGVKAVVSDIREFVSRKSGSEEVTIAEFRLAHALPGFKAMFEASVEKHSTGSDMKSLAEKMFADDGDGSGEDDGGAPDDEKGTDGPGDDAKRSLKDIHLPTPADGVDDRLYDDIHFIQDRRRKSIFGNMGPEDKSYWYRCKKALAKHHGQPLDVPPWFEASMADGLDDVIDKFYKYMPTPFDREGERRRPHHQPMIVSARDHLKAQLHRGLKANELNYSTQTGFGDEWVITVWQPRLWFNVEMEDMFLGLLPMIDMPTNPFKIPLEGADPEVYLGSEPTDDPTNVHGRYPSSKVGTDDLELTASKLVTSTPMSEEITEDSLIAFVPNARRQQLRAMRNAISYIILNGDTATGNTNINKDGAATVTSDKFLAVDGFVKHALVNAATLATVDGSGAQVTLSNLRGLHRKLHPQLQNRNQQLLYLVDSSTYTSLRDITEILSAEQYAGRIRGEVRDLDGIPIMRSYQLGLAKANGKISNTVAQNTLGRALLITRDYARVGYRRRISTWDEFDRKQEEIRLGASVRLAFKLRDTTRKSCAIAYNLKVD